MWVNFCRPLKEEKNVGQFLTAEVTNPGQNGSQQMFLHSVTGGKKNEAKWLARILKQK